MYLLLTSSPSTLADLVPALLEPTDRSLSSSLEFAREFLLRAAAIRQELQAGLNFIHGLFSSLEECLGKAPGETFSSLGMR